jgi:hypothetical protein
MGRLTAKTSVCAANAALPAKMVLPKMVKSPEI